MARATDTRRAGGGTIQSLHDSDLTAEEYVKRKAWWDATAPPCPYHPNGGCTLVPHGTYVRKCPKGMRVRRFLCKGTGRTVSALPSCMLAHWTGTVRKLERDADEAARASTQEAAADELRPETADPLTAVRWVRRREQAVRSFLSRMRTLHPERFEGLEPTLDAFRECLDRKRVLPHLRRVAKPRLGALAAPMGFVRGRRNAERAPSDDLQHATGLDPPAEPA